MHTLGLVLLMSSAAQCLAAAVLGQFVATDPHTLPSSWTRAVALENGKVLVVSGALGQLFDPQTNTFRDLPPALMNHSLHAMHRLDDGRVLIVGTNNTNNGAAELYDPQDQTFKALPPMVTPRYGVSLARLPDGKVLVIGGVPQGQQIGERRTEIFNPETNQFASGPLMMQTRFYPAVATAPNGQVFVFGGAGGAPIPYSVEVYSPATGQFASRAGRMRFGRVEATATTLPDGRILVVGGRGGSPYYAGEVIHSSSEIYTPATDSFAPMQFMATTRTHHTSTMLPNGTVLVLGGKTDMGSMATWGEIYNPVAGRWDHVTGQMTFGRYLHDTVSLGDGRAIVVGGQDDFGRAPWGEIYLPDRITTRNFER
jgi:hypothetical protein